MHRNLGVRVAIIAMLTTLAAALTWKDALPPVHLLRAVGIGIAGVALVLLLIRAVKFGIQREAVPSALWALAMLALIGALGWDMRLIVVSTVLILSGIVLAKRYRVAL